MGDMRGFVGSGGSSEHERDEQILMPKAETLDFDLPCDTTYSQQFGDNAASSSGSNVRSLLIEMGFQPSLIQKAIEEKGEDDIDLLLETLMKESVVKHPGKSMDGLIRPKQEPGVAHEDEDRRMALLTMSFPENLVDLAIDKLGKDAPIDEMVDFIIAAQLAEKLEEESDQSCEEEPDVVPVAGGAAAAKRPEVSDEFLFETMGKTLHLLEMGFTDHEISLAVDKLGSKGQISELAEMIVTGEVPGDPEEIEEKVSGPLAGNDARPSKNWRFLGAERKDDRGSSSTGKVNIKPDSGCGSLPSQNIGSVEETSRGKRLKDEDGDAYPEAYTDFDDRGKRLRPDYMGSSSSFFETPWMEENIESKEDAYDIPKALQPRLSQTLDPGVARSPYFFYGNFANTSPHWWSKISKCVTRKEGYVHNLPTENRFHILPKPVTSMQDALPQLKSWWPSWDIRKHFNGICSSTGRESQLCDRLGHLLAESRGIPSEQQRKLILHQGYASNLIWIAPRILSPMEPEHLERILGYPSSHTDISGTRSAERLKLFEYCFQTDTVGYHLSVLKGMFPTGITVLSIFSGIGGAEVALDRLGIKLKGVVSVEPCGLSRSILKKWWQRSGQPGELVQIEEIQSLKTKKLETLVERFGGFDLIICQNPPTPPDLSKEHSERIPLEFEDFSLFTQFVRVLERVRDMTATS
ncbi:PREDICTED: DNA (cytosine-5)-methyltransferase DRM1 [Tarenaya hassleriana]|uniref:DNA (cytosine-5)-methyltransferase DRM1 n=1 Tax=Tarenaya hassleriana TaxID=28532 RepID=UPI00053C5CB7|nr:PREDICTED: DNA (cytosine-5)-methyltransferase DRM1 [Tarenaya hassleriana]